MARYTRTQDAKAPREKVFRYLTEVERFPELFPEIFTKMKVVGNDGGSRTIECEEKFAGRKFRYSMEEKQFPPERIEHVIINGNGKGTVETLRLEEIPGGTRVTMDIEAKGVAAAILGRLFRKQFESEMKQIFDGYMRVVEATE